MSDHGVRFPYFRCELVPAVLALAMPTWQREVWLDLAEVEGLDHVVHALFDDFCDADDPARYLGATLRTEEEVELMGRLGRVYGAVQDAVGASAPDETYLDHPSWGEVAAVAARLAQRMVMNDLVALRELHDRGHRWPPAAPEPSDNRDDSYRHRRRRLD